MIILLFTHRNSLFSAVVSSGIPYSIILGNHDREGDLSPLQILKLDRLSSPQTSYTLSPHHSIAMASTDYILPVYKTVGNISDSEITLLMIFMDSGREVL